MELIAICGFITLSSALVALVAVVCAAYISVLGMYHVHRTKKILEAEINSLPERVQEVLAAYAQPLREDLNPANPKGVEPNERTAIVEDEDEFEIWSHPGMSRYVTDVE